MINHFSNLDKKYVDKQLICDVIILSLTLFNLNMFECIVTIDK